MDEATKSYRFADTPFARSKIRQMRSVVRMLEGTSKLRALVCPDEPRKSLRLEVTAPPEAFALVDDLVSTLHARIASREASIDKVLGGLREHQQRTKRAAVNDLLDAMSKREPN